MLWYALGHGYLVIDRSLQRLIMSYSAFGCTSLHPLLSLLVAKNKMATAKNQDGESQNAELRASKRQSTNQWVTSR